MEQQQRQLLVKALNQLKLDAVSVENPACPGTPDVNYIGGWVELKYAVDWPARDDTPLRLDHFTPQQRCWLRRRWHFGGNVWLCLQVSKTRHWIVFDGETAAKHLGKDGYHRDKLLGIAAFVGGSAEEVARFLSIGRRDAHSN